MSILQQSSSKINWVYGVYLRFKGISLQIIRKFLTRGYRKGKNSNGSDGK